MKHAFFWIGAMDPGSAQEELNRFVCNHRVIAVERHFVASGPSPAWAVAVQYVDGVTSQQDPKKNRVDYREVLDPGSFSVFAALRAYRKQVADAERVPAYTILTNEQMAAVARTRPSTLEELGRVEGVGDSRVRKYGQALLDVVRSTAGASTGPNADRGDDAP